MPWASLGLLRVVATAGVKATMLDPQEDTMATRHLAVDEIAQRAQLRPRPRSALATTTVPTGAPSAQLVDAPSDLERTATALAHRFGRPQVTEIRRHGQ